MRRLLLREISVSGKRCWWYILGRRRACSVWIHDRWIHSARLRDFVLQSQQQEDHSGLHSLGLEVWLLPVLEIVLCVSIRSKAFLGDENYFGAAAVP